MSHNCEVLTCGVSDQKHLWKNEVNSTGRKQVTGMEINGREVGYIDM